MRVWSAMHYRDPVSDYIYQLKHLRSSLVYDDRVLRLDLTHDPSLNHEAVRPHMSTSETGLMVPSHVFIGLKRLSIGLCPWVL